jgi:hypothetical protein
MFSSIWMTFSGALENKPVAAKLMLTGFLAGLCLYR